MIIVGVVVARNIKNVMVIRYSNFQTGESHKRSVLGKREHRKFAIVLWNLTLGNQAKPGAARPAKRISSRSRQARRCAISRRLALRDRIFKSFQNTIIKYYL